MLRRREEDFERLDREKVGLADMETTTKQQAKLKDDVRVLQRWKEGMEEDLERMRRDVTENAPAQSNESIQSVRVGTLALQFWLRKFGYMYTNFAVPVCLSVFGVHCSPFEGADNL